MHNFIDLSYNKLNTRVCKLRVIYEFTTIYHFTKLRYILFLSKKSCDNNLRIKFKIKTFANCSSWTQFKAFSNPITSLISTLRIGDIHIILARAKQSWSSLMHIPMSTLFWCFKKEASILHLYRPLRYYCTGTSGFSCTRPFPLI
jgi:hypothetical protein